MMATMPQDDLENGAFGTTIEGLEEDTDDSPKETSGEENNENCNTENVDKTDEVPRKRRKLSPIIYNRSHSPSPARLKSNALILPALATKRMHQIEFCFLLITGICFKQLEHIKNCIFCFSALVADKRSMENTVPTHLDKSRENCRYWPNCTLGNKCAYLHPSMMCR